MIIIVVLISVLHFVHIHLVQSCVNFFISLENLIL